MERGEGNGCCCLKEKKQEQGTGDKEKLRDNKIIMSAGIISGFFFSIVV
jgi:hypothetical protein